MNKVLKEYKKRKTKIILITRLILISTILLFVILFLIIHKNNSEYNPLYELKIVEENNKTTTTFNSNDEILLNPGKGFVLRELSNKDYDELTSVLYYRFRWCDIEPEEGAFEWSVIDKKIEDAIERNKKIAFGVVNASTSSSTIKYITPEWVFRSGAEYYEYTNSDGNIQVIPNWTDEIYLEKLNSFIKALAERYDGNENIAFIDIRSYGNWGEGHLIPIGGDDITAEQLQDLYIKPYMDNFKETRLVIPWGLEEYNETYNWAIDNGVSVRRDGIMKYSNGQSCFEYAYGKVPTIFEYSNKYTTLKENGLWSEEKLLEYIETWKPSYTEIWPEMYEDNPEFCKYIANKIGYYFRVKEANYTNTVEVASDNNISLKFINEGVAPLYEDCTVYIGLLDENYNLVKKYKTDIDPHTWMPNEEKIENISITFDDIEPGNYIISLGLFLNENDENPTYLLGNTGKTDDKWYVFGELNITEKQEVYNINLENEDYFVNNLDKYTVNVTVDNLNENYTYVIERYINNVLIENANITNFKSTYNNSFDLDLPEGNNTIKIIIKRNGEEVSKLEKNIYTYSAQENLNAISNTALEKYAEFEEKFEAEISSINGLQEEINTLKQYMSSIANNTTEDENVAIEQMNTHFNLGNVILSAYKNGSLDVEYVKLSSMLDMLNDIGDSYEDLLTVCATTRAPYYQATEELINSAENKINNNSDLEIVYPSKILDFAKELDEKSEYINSLSEENDIKTGLIVSNSLHAYYLADWANEFASIYIDEYIEANPVTVSYSNSTEWTNEDVVATLNIGNDATVTNNGGSNTYTFRSNGSFTFEYERRGQAFTLEAKVSNIDKTYPTITGVKDGQTYTNSVKPVIEDTNLSFVSISYNGEDIEYYEGITLEDEGIYSIVATDRAGNTTTVEFNIISAIQDEYIIQDNYLLNVWQETTLTDFKNNFTSQGESYTIKRNDTELTDTDIIATGDTIELSSGDTYTIVVAGDINCDGRVTVFDFSALRRYILKQIEFTEIELLAADINIDSNDVGVKDYSRMRIEILGRY